jgi:hypothetical protein
MVLVLCNSSISSITGVFVEYFHKVIIYANFNFLQANLNTRYIIRSFSLFGGHCFFIRLRLLLIQQIKVRLLVETIKWYLTSPK